MILKCNFCFSDFEEKNKKRLFCSKECYGLSRRGSKRPEVGLKISNALKGKTHTSKRIEKIKKANTVVISEDKKQKIITLWNFGLTDSTILKEVCVGSKPFLRFKNEFYYENGFDKKNYLKFVTISYSEILKIIDLGRKKMSYKRIARTLGISMKTTRKVLKFYQEFLKEDIFHSYDEKSFCFFKQTKIEKIIEDFLQENNIKFESEFVVGNTSGSEYSSYRFDFKIIDKKIFIEVNGDYWHSNPEIYQDDSKLSDAQIKNKNRDILKLEKAKSMNYDVFYVWENDLKTKKEETLKLLLEKINDNN